MAARQELAEKYNRFARWYDLVEGIPDLLGIRKLRRRLLGRVSGTVLEVAVGTGKNLSFYPHASRVIAVDFSREMLKVARRRSEKLPVECNFLLADAEALPFANESIGTVVTSLSSCTFPNPVAALDEISRVCKPEGRVFLLEHGRSDRDWLAAFQDRHAERFAQPLGCHWNREPQEIARASGLEIIEARRYFFGIFHVIVAVPKLLQP